MSVFDNPANVLSGGRKTVTTHGTRVQLNSSTAGITTVTIQALATNTNKVFVGGSDVVAAAGSENGIGLNAGQTITLQANSLSLIYLDSITDGEGVSYLLASH